MLPALIETRNDYHGLLCAKYASVCYKYLLYMVYYGVGKL